ncbi:hypothetical protein PVAG01_01815 [Phlyctema vagabunda]|uniref:Uncharacterized protein n=1 Tax=Phlyctema vagabunda TaxID=108571 RepID=A0ABR4PYI1_9HELO
MTDNNNNQQFEIPGTWTCPELTEEQIALLTKQSEEIAAAMPIFDSPTHDGVHQAQSGASQSSQASSAFGYPQTPQAANNYPSSPPVSTVESARRSCMTSNIYPGPSSYGYDTDARGFQNNNTQAFGNADGTPSASPQIPGYADAGRSLVKSPPPKPQVEWGAGYADAGRYLVKSSPAIVSEVPRNKKKAKKGIAKGTAKGTAKGSFKVPDTAAKTQLNTPKVASATPKVRTVAAQLNASLTTLTKARNAPRPRARAASSIASGATRSPSTGSSPNTNYTPSPTLPQLAPSFHCNLCVQSMPLATLPKFMKARLIEHGRSLHRLEDHELDSLFPTEGLVCQLCKQAMPHANMPGMTKVDLEKHGRQLHRLRDDEIEEYLDSALSALGVDNTKKEVAKYRSPALPSLKATLGRPTSTALSTALGSRGQVQAPATNGKKGGIAPKTPAKRKRKDKSDDDSTYGYGCHICPQEGKSAPPMNMAGLLKHGGEVHGYVGDKLQNFFLAAISSLFSNQHRAVNTNNLQVVLGQNDNADLVDDAHQAASTNAAPGTAAQTAGTKTTDTKTAGTKTAATKTASPRKRQPAKKAASTPKQKNGNTPSTPLNNNGAQQGLGLSNMSFDQGGSYVSTPSLSQGAPYFSQPQSGTSSYTEQSPFNGNQIGGPNATPPTQFTGLGFGDPNAAYHSQFQGQNFGMPNNAQGTSSLYPEVPAFAQPPLSQYPSVPEVDQDTSSSRPDFPTFGQNTQGKFGGSGPNGPQNNDCGGSLTENWPSFESNDELSRILDDWVPAEDVNAQSNTQLNGKVTQTPANNHESLESTNLNNQLEMDFDAAFDDEDELAALREEATKRDGALSEKVSVDQAPAVDTHSTTDDQLGELVTVPQSTGADKPLAHNEELSGDEDEFPFPDPSSLPATNEGLHVQELDIEWDESGTSLRSADPNIYVPAELLASWTKTLKEGEAVDLEFAYDEENGEYVSKNGTFIKCPKALGASTTSSPLSPGKRAREVDDANEEPAEKRQAVEEKEKEEEEENDDDDDDDVDSLFDGPSDD